MSEILNINEFEANQGKIDTLSSKNATINTLDSKNSTINTLTADFIKLKNQIELLSEELKILKGSKELVKISANRTDINNALYVNNELISLPVGAIVAFFGDKVPEGWAFCNGQNGTPDLRGSFIQGRQDLSQKNGQIYTSNTITLSEKHIPRVWSTVKMSFYKAEAGTNGNNFDFLGTRSTSRNTDIKRNNSWCSDEDISADFAIGHEKPTAIQIPDPQHLKLAYIMKIK